MGVDLILWHISFHLTTVANANLLANLIPFTVIPLSLILYQEKIKQGFYLALVIVILGLIILVSGKVKIQITSLTGDFLAIATSFFYGLYFMTIHYLRKVENYSTGYIIFISAFGSLLVLVPYALFFESNYFPSTINGALILLSVAIISHILGQGLLAVSLRETSVILGSVLVLTQPVIAAIYSYFIFNEVLTDVEIIGIFIVILGIFIAKRNT